jgi:hypothetical protein
MKKIISLTIIMMFVLAFGMAYAGECMAKSVDTGSFLNDVDPGNGRTAPLDTGPMPEVTGARGSAAGGISEKQDGFLNDIDPSNGRTAPLDTGLVPEVTGAGGSAAGGRSGKQDSFLSDIDPSTGSKGPLDSGQAW